MDVRYMLSAWRTIRIPGLLPFMRDWMPFVRMHFLFAALETGLLQVLVTGATRQVLLEKLAVKRPELLDALLDMGLALKELRLHDGVFSLKGRRARILADSGGDVMAALVQANLTYYSASYRNLAERLRGAPLGSDLQEIGATVARFSKIAEPVLDSFIKSLVPPSGPFRVLDVGCGSGFVLKTACQVNEAVRGFGIDSDASVVSQARCNLEKWGLQGRFDIIAGDIRSHAGGLQDRFNLITAFNIIYYFSMEARTAFFSLLHSLLSPGGVLALVSNFQSKGRDVGAAHLNIVNSSLENLCALPSLETIKTQLAESGFTRIKVTRFLPRSEFYGVTAYG